MVTNPVGYLSSPYLRALGTSVLPLMTIDIDTYAPSNVPASMSLFNLHSCAGAILDQTTNLETPNLHMCGGIQHGAPIPTFPKLKTLRITHSRLNQKDLEGLLSSCTGLRTFVFEATYPYVSRLDYVQDFGPRDHFSLDNAVKYLGQHRATLKSLHLDLWERGVGYFVSEVNARLPFFHLKDFKALEHLFFNSHGIYGDGEKHLLAEDQLLVWFLSASIVSLHLQGQTGHLLSRLPKGLLGLAEVVSEGRFPRLKQVRCDAQNVLDDYPVCSAFAAVGVDFGGDTFPLSKEPMPLPEEDDADL